MSASSDYQTAYRRARERIGAAAWDAMPLPRRAREIEVEFWSLANVPAAEAWQTIGPLPNRKPMPDGSE